jgi:hypothetical protein
MGAGISATTAYHPQSNGQSERTNQTAEIALRYDLELNPDTDFTEFLPAFKRVFNNSVNASTGRSPNQITHGFNLADSFGVVTEGDAKDFEAERKVHQQEAQDSIAWANLAIKKGYDKRHTSLLLNPGDLLMLKLHHGYRVPGIKNKKLSIQTRRSFQNQTARLPAGVRAYICFPILDLFNILESLLKQRNLRWIHISGAQPL